jgi:hypothetical protein
MFSLSSRLDNMVKSKGSAGIIGVPFAILDLPVQQSETQKPGSQSSRKSALDLPSIDREKQRNTMPMELRKKLESGIIFSGDDKVPVDDSTVLSNNPSVAEKVSTVAPLTFKLLALTRLSATIENAKFDLFKDDSGPN